MRAVRLAFALSISAACRPSSASPEPDSADAAPRAALFTADHPHQAAFEAPELVNECTADAECHRAGCGERVCSAEAEVMSTCEVLPVSLPADASCGCLEGACRWWSPSGATPIATAEPPPQPAGEPPVGPCATARCAAPTQCIEYAVNEAPQVRLRRQAVGRKNWLFIGSEVGALANTTFVSLLASCQMHGIEPQGYLRDLLCLLPTWPTSRVLELAPAYWKQTLEQEETQRLLAANVFRQVALCQLHPDEQ